MVVDFDVIRTCGSVTWATVESPCEERQALKLRQISFHALQSTAFETVTFTWPSIPLPVAAGPRLWLNQAQEPMNEEAMRVGKQGGRLIGCTKAAAHEFLSSKKVNKADPDLKDIESTGHNYTSVWSSDPLIHFFKFKEARTEIVDRFVRS